MPKQWWNPVSFGNQLTAAAKRATAKAPTPWSPVGAVSGALRNVPAVKLPGAGDVTGAIRGAVGKAVPAAPQLPGAALPGLGAAAGAIGGAFGKGALRRPLPVPPGLPGAKTLPALDALPLPAELPPGLAQAPPTDRIPPDVLAALGGLAGGMGMMRPSAGEGSMLKSDLDPQAAADLAQMGQAAARPIGEEDEEELNRQALLQQMKSVG